MFDTAMPLSDFPTSPATVTARLDGPRHQRLWEIANDVAPSTYFGLDRNLCGICTLECSDGERHVDQTVDLASHLASHRRRWEDVIAVSTFECGQSELDALERTLITQTEHSFTLRNKAFTKVPGGDAAIDLVENRQQQAERLDDTQTAHPSTNTHAP